MDHAEGIVVWEAASRRPRHLRDRVGRRGAAAAVRRESARPDVAMHFPVEAWWTTWSAYGMTMPDRIVAIAPNVAKPHSRGRIWITVADPDSPAGDRLPVLHRPRRSRRSRAGRRPCAPPAGSPRAEPMAGCLLRREVFPDSRRDRTTSCRVALGPPTKPSTTSAGPAGWAPTTTRWRSRFPAAGARRGRAAGGRRLGVPHHPFGQPGRHHHGCRRAGRRSDLPGPVISRPGRTTFAWPTGWRGRLTLRVPGKRTGISSRRSYDPRSSTATPSIPGSPPWTSATAQRPRWLHRVAPFAMNSIHQGGAGGHQRLPPVS